MEATTLPVLLSPALASREHTPSRGAAAFEVLGQIVEGQVVDARQHRFDRFDDGTVRLDLLVPPAGGEREKGLSDRLRELSSKQVRWGQRL